jgi:hypothetical protein
MMAGFDYEETIKLRFEDPKLDGLVVRMESVPIGEYTELIVLADAARRSGGEQAPVMEKLFGLFADALIEWNLRLRGVDVSADLAGVRRMPSRLFGVVLEAWMEGMAGPDRPLPTGSPFGGQFPEQLIPMEPLSASPAS